MGTRNAAVFPEPVLAMATTSLPSITSGIHCIQKAKGVENNLVTGNYMVKDHQTPGWSVRT